MLTYISNDGKTYEERMGEAIMQIPLYTEDWTDFNASDPGMTILETLSGFETLQQEKILDVPQRVPRNLLALVGFYAQRGRGARLLLAADEVRRPVTIPQNFRFLLGELSFETNRVIEIDDYKVLGVYGKKKDAQEYREFRGTARRGRRALHHYQQINASGKGDGFLFYPAGALQSQSSFKKNAKCIC